MNKILSALLVLCAPLAGMAQAQEHLLWSTSELQPGSQANEHISGATDAAGNTYTIDLTQDATDFHLTYRFYRYAPDGSKQWSFANSTYFTDSQDKYYLVVPVDNNGAIFIGVYDDVANNRQLRIKRIGLDGGLMWQQNWAFPYAWMTPAKAMLDGNGRLVVGATIQTTATATDDFGVAVFDTANSGALVWETVIPDGGSGVFNLFEQLSDLSLDAANNIYGCGIGSNGFTGNARNYYFRLNPAGSMDYKLSTSAAAPAARVLRARPDAGGNLFLLTTADNTIAVEKKAATTGLAINGAALTHDSASLEAADMIVANGSVYVLGNYRYSIPDSSFAGSHLTNRRFFVSRMDTACALLWQQGLLDDLHVDTPDVTGNGATQLAYTPGGIYAVANVARENTTLLTGLARMDATTGTTLWYDTVTATYGNQHLAVDAAGDAYLSRSVLGGALTSLVQRFSQATTATSGPGIARVAAVAFPNPATGMVRVSVAGAGGMGWRLYSATGAVLRSGASAAPAFDVDVSTLPAGIYCLMLEGQNWNAALKIQKL